VTTDKLHADEVDIDAALVQRLLASQMPELAGLAIVAVRSTGTVNAIFRLGDELCVRMPRVARYARDLEKELEWLPQLAPRVSLTIPSPESRGEPGHGYPFTWAVYRWIDGETYATDRVADERTAAQALAGFVDELRTIDTAGAPPSGRAPLHTLDEMTRDAIDRLPAAFGIAPDAAHDAWAITGRAPVWDGVACWRHADLLPPNVLVAGGHLHAVIDWGAAGIGDPAIDLIAAWSMFGAAGRAAYRERLQPDDGDWDRARGIALHQALLIIPYYAETNPAFSAMAARTVARVLDELGASD
jgi:aminoglycoside phosphotransferase (APT) family kinase protein